MPNDVKLDLYFAHRPALVEYAATLLGDRGHAEDLVQEAFLRFVPDGRPGDAAILNPAAYLYRIVRNLAFDGHRRSLLEGQHMEGGADQAATTVAADIPSPEAAASARQELERVLAAMAELPERTRIALEMHRFGGCKLKEIAAHLGISTSMAQILVIEGVRHCQRRL